MNEQEMIEIHQISTELALLTQQIKVLADQMSEIKIDIKDIKGTQADKINSLEKEVAVLKERVDRMEWIWKIIIALSTTALVGAILSLIIKH